MFKTLNRHFLRFVYNVSYEVFSAFIIQLPRCSHIQIRTVADYQWEADIWFDKQDVGHE